jgi:hypothetical protein
MKLEIALIPKSSWYKGIRTILTNDQVEKLRGQLFAKANNICQICEVHTESLFFTEEYKFDDIYLTQTLVKFIAICEDCHLARHMGLATIKGKYSRAVKHFQKVNDLSINEAKTIISAAFTLWRHRSNYNYYIDLVPIMFMGLDF